MNNSKQPRIKSIPSSLLNRWSFSLKLALLLFTGCVLHAQQIYVIDFGTNNQASSNPAVGEYQYSGTQASVVSDPLVTGTTGLWDVAVSGSNLFVVNKKAGTVNEYTTAGVPVATPLISGLTNPGAIAVSGTLLFITNDNQAGLSNGFVAEYSTSGDSLVPFLIGGFTDAFGLTISGTDIYVSDAFSATVGKYGMDGSTENANLVTGLGDPQGVAVSGTNLYIADEQSGNVDQYSTSGDLISTSFIPGVNARHIAVAGSHIFTDGDVTNAFGEYNLDGSIVNDQLITGLVDPGAFAVVVPSLSGTLPDVASFSANGPVTPGAAITFEATTSPGLSVVVESSTNPADDTSWVPFPSGSAMTENAAANPGAGNYSLTSTDYPYTAGVSFRALSSKSNFASGTSAPLGPYDLSASISFGATGPASPGAPINFTSEPFIVVGGNTDGVSGFSVRAQSTTTPDVEGSWTDLSDGGMTEDSQNPGNYTVSSSAYASGTDIYFRSIAARFHHHDIISAPLGPFSLQQAALSISAALSSTTDPAHGATAHIGDSLTFSYTVENSGSATARNLKVTVPVPTYIQAGTNLTTQFSKTDVTTISSGGTYVAASSSSANDAKIVWNSGDLDPNSLFTDTFTVKISTSVRTIQGVSTGNGYAVASTTNQPKGTVTGFTSGAPNVGTRIEGPISFEVTPLSASITPGGLLTYHCVLANLTTTTVPHPIAVITVPEFARFDPDGYPLITSSKNAPAVAYTSRAGAPPFHQVFVTGNDNPEIVIVPTQLMPAGDKKGRDSIAFNVTFQVQWVDPTEVTSISSVNYGAAFFDESTFLSTLTGKKTTEYAIFAADYLASASTNLGSTSPIDFYNFITDPGNKLAVSSNDSGVVNVHLGGSAAAAPNIHLLKLISDLPADVASDGASATDVVSPGSQITFLLMATNTGLSAADDVYLEDGMPDHSTLVANSAKILSSDSKKFSSLKVIPDSDGHHLLFQGLHLEPQDNVVVEYTVQVASGGGAPAQGSFINSDNCTIGSSSTPHTPVGIYLNGPIQVIGTIAFAQPKVRRLFIPPTVSGTDITATANALTSIFNANANADPIKIAVPGYERYYIHYANIGNVAAKDVKLEVPLPAHNAFYRASFVKLPPTKVAGDAGGFPGTLIVPPNGDSIIPPAGPAGGFLSTGGTVTFTFNKLAAATGASAANTGGDVANVSGDVMVEVIITPDAAGPHGAVIDTGSDAPVTIHDGTVPGIASGMDSALVHADDLNSVLNDLAAHKSSSPFGAIAVNDSFKLAPAIPEVGLYQAMPLGVKPGETFTVQIVAFNHGDVDADAIVDYTIPANTVYVSATAGQSFLETPPGGEGSGPGTIVEVALATNDGPITTESVAPFHAHSAAALSVTLRATGAPGTLITGGTAQLTTDFFGKVFAGIYNIPISSEPDDGIFSNIIGEPMFETKVNSGDVDIIDLGAGNIVASGGGNIVAQGGGNIVAQGGGNIVAQGGGNIVAQGGGNLIPIGATTGGSLLANEASLVASHAASVIVPTGATIVAQGGGNIIAAGGGSIVAQGGGNFSTTGPAAIVAQGGGNISQDSDIVAQGGGNIVAQGGGNIVAQGGGNIVAAGGGNIVAKDGASALSSQPGTTAMIKTAEDHAISGGGGFMQNSQ